MKCVIPGINIKVFGRAVHSLARIGDELYVEPSPAGVFFRTVNSSRSAFSSFFFAPGFFSYYDSGGQPRDTADTDEDHVRCKVAMRAVYDKNSCPQHFTSQSRLLSEVVLNFQLNQDEVTFHTTPDKITIRNYVEDEPDPAKAIHTELALQADEFDEYSIDEDIEITFCLKELRAVLGFTEPVNLPISAYFSEPGSPIIIVAENPPMFEATFVFATLSQGSSNDDRSVKVNTSMNRKGAAKPSPKAASPSMETSRRISSFHSNALARSSSNVQNGDSSVRSGIPTTSKQLEKPLSSSGPSTPVRMNEITAGPSLSQNRSNSFRQDNFTENAVNARGMHSPVTKKAKFFFKRCFESTFNPETIPGYGVVLASDSDEED